MRAGIVLTATTLSVGVSLITFGCGSGPATGPTVAPDTATSVATAPSPSVSTTPAEPVTPAEVAATSTVPSSLANQADELCAAHQNVDANEPIQFDGFDPEHPDPDILPSIAEQFAPALAASIELQHSLARLDRGSAAEAALLLDLLHALDAENRNAAAQASAAQTSDVDGFTATLPHVEPLTVTRIDAALALGAPACAIA